MNDDISVIQLTPHERGYIAGHKDTMDGRYTGGMGSRYTSKEDRHQFMAGYEVGEFVAQQKLEQQAKDEGNQQAKADARLRAAAPDLLRALELMQRALAQTMPCVKYGVCQDYAILNDAPIAAQAAIAKALGK